LNAAPDGLPHAVLAVVVEGAGVEADPPLDGAVPAGLLLDLLELLDPHAATPATTRTHARTFAMRENTLLLLRLRLMAAGDQAGDRPDAS
jgi:hypothetical protein